MKHYTKTFYSDAQEAAYWDSREYRESRTGFCASCGAQTLDFKRSLCDACLEHQRGLRATRRQRGLCTKCGGPLPEGSRWRTCEDCRRTGRAHQKRHLARRGKPDRSQQWRRVFIQCPVCLERQAIFAGWRQDRTGARRKHEGPFYWCRKCETTLVKFEQYMADRDPELGAKLKREAELQKSEAEQHDVEGGN